MRREPLVLVLVLLAGLALAAPFAEAKGGYYGDGGRRSACHASDTNLDGVVSERERAEQCGSASSWPVLALFGGALVAGAVGLQKLRTPSLALGATGTIDGRRSFTVEGRLTYRNDEGDSWKEYLLRLDDGSEAWLEVDGADVRIHRLWPVAATLDPPTVDGRPVRVLEEGRMRLAHADGSLPDDEHSPVVDYVDGRLADGRLVGIESDAHGTEAFLTYEATLGRGGAVDVRGSSPWR